MAVVGDAWIPHGSEQDRVVAVPERFEGAAGQDLSRRQEAFRAPGEDVPREIAAAAPGPFEQGQGFRHHLGADAVSRNHRQPRHTAPSQNGNAGRSPQVP